MRWVPDHVENRGELAALIVFLSVGGLIVADTLALAVVAELIAALGFAVALPLALVFGDRLVESDEESTSEDALEELRDRYARGEITHEEFERRVERLVATEDVDASEVERSTVREVERDLE